MSQRQPPQQQQQSQAEIDYERQFQEDLAKATALSLEQQALDEYRRNKKYGYSTSSSINTGNTTSNYERSQSIVSGSNATDGAQYYAQLRERYNARTLSTSSGQQQQHTTNATTSYTTQHTSHQHHSHHHPRRHSEVSNFPAAINAATNNITRVNLPALQRSQTPPPPITTPENDLISFASPRSKEPELPGGGDGTRSFEQMIDDLHKLQITNRTALVPLGPTAAAPNALAMQQQHTMYRSAPPTALYIPGVQQAPPQFNPGNAAGMQLVPFVPPPASSAPQKVPLTNDELQKLYNMPHPQQQAFMQAHHQRMIPGNVYMPRAYSNAIGTFATHSAPPTAGATAYAATPPQFSAPYGFHYNPVAGTSSSSSTATAFYQPQTATVAGTHSMIGSQQVNSNSAGTALNGNITNNNSIGGGSGVGAAGSSSSNTSASASILRRQTPPARRPRNLGDNLIDLSQEDDSRVSVLEAFDPLLNDENSGNDDASDCTSYYAEYDPFDYLYSGGGTQYSDPVYEAVNKLDTSAVSPNVSTIGWRQEFTSDAYNHAEEYASSTPNSAIYTSLSSARLSTTQPPPLPPRNLGDAVVASTSSGFIYPDLPTDDFISGSSTSATRLHAIKDEGTSQVLDRRKTCSRLYEMVTDQRTTDPELLEFYYMVKELRARYPYDDEQTNVGHIIASEFNYHYSLGTSIKILVHPALNTLFPDAKAATADRDQVKGYGMPVVFTCDITTAVEMVIGQAFCSLEGQIRGNVNDYAVKPIGVAEWLSPTSKLSQLECVHNSLKLERDVNLALCLKTSENLQVISRTQRDDLRDAELRAEDVLPNEMASTISYDNMMILIETLETEIDKLESAASECNTRTILSCSGVVQGVKAICALLGSIDTLETAKCIQELKRICDDGQMRGSVGGGGGGGSGKLSASPTLSLNGRNGTATGSNSPITSNQANPEIGSDYGDYAEVCLRPRSVLEQIKIKCNQLRDAVQELIELYSNVFRVGFSVRSFDYSTTPLPISCVSKPIIVSINCLHRPPPNWKYDDYSLGVQIYYGTRFISDPVVIKCSNDTSGGLFARLNFLRWIEFTKNQINTLPRESRLIFVLYGTQSAENEQNTDANGERRQVTTELGWCAIQLFDHRREMIFGSYLLSMWPPTADKFLGPAPARGCHPQPDICPVLSIEIPSYGGRIQFPEPVENPAPAPRFDFYSLDTNLQQELQDIIEQSYPGATDKREVFWEKRHYLQNFPNALGKVLHAAHKWDDASLKDLHSLLHSWSALSPLQALELLLPRYPDAKVREKAVEWISQLPNDQLVDYLPQLLQALKHDTYEASSMARFLLSKCLESPRIAHHTYWLLVHSLPGDDPQNSIDASSVANEFTDSLITQARYYRRNKMMLRALLTICGEKLLARFLRQNMMCKNLAITAESVKEAKESLRQKTLVYGMDTIHQELVDKPTSLPLGPELEVTGVNVRSCSYFNSNTLPLKISYIGSDSETLPAIFKSGDDLQQDMLTIQLIRVMNKMWLAEGLDLKIVTFNCVPTGYKKGMIELVSDAETLRKIQVEYGLTGSFKDRPIAEWLAKQNPSQLEYQRAVKNFTVSCAGYSVATYILGICDRHNDNIMLKTSGHLFHIDFGKFLGDAQMFGNFKRDRTPFVLTSDMAYVINGGDKPSTDFHYFVDLCCRAFNIIRKHGHLILHMLALMATAGIPGVTADAVTYVRRALLPSQSNPEAAASFAKMIQFSLKSWFTQFNFFLHNLAQMRFTNDEGSGELLSFVPRKYTMQQDGRLKSVMVVRCQKHYDMEKYYTYILEVTRHGQTDPTHLFRSYKEFTEFHQKLCLHFPLAKLHSLPTGMHVGRSNVKSVAERRLPEVRRFLKSLFSLADEIAHSDLVYTFFHPLLRDQQEAKLEVSKVRELKQPIVPESPYEIGQIKISLQYRRDALTVMIHHAKGLPMLQGGQEPNTYVKCYLKPDATKVTKRKTKVVRKTCVPSFMETLEYRMPLEHIQSRILHVTVWSHDTLQENELLGGFQIDLSKFDLRQELVDWFRLGPMSRN